MSGGYRVLPETKGPPKPPKMAGATSAAPFSPQPLWMCELWPGTVPEGGVSGGADLQIPRAAPHAHLTWPRVQIPEHRRLRGAEDRRGGQGGIRGVAARPRELNGQRVRQRGHRRAEAPFIGGLWGGGPCLGPSGAAGRFRGLLLGHITAALGEGAGAASEGLGRHDKAQGTTHAAGSSRRWSGTVVMQRPTPSHEASDGPCTKACAADETRHVPGGQGWPGRWWFHHKRKKNRCPATSSTSEHRNRTCSVHKICFKSLLQRLWAD